MRSTLEKALIALLSEDKDQAAALFHDYILSRSRQINESLVQGETFVLNESEEPTFQVDAVFTEADLQAAPAIVEDEDGDDDESSDEGEGDDDEVSESTERQFPFDTGHDGDATTYDEAYQEGLEAYEAGVEHNPYDPETQPELYNGFEAGQDEGRENAEDGGDFEDLGESLVNDLKKVEVIKDEGGTTGGDKVKVNKTSPGLQPKINDRMKGTPAETTPDEHNGFAMEKAPKVAKVPKYENNK